MSEEEEQSDGERVVYVYDSSTVLPESQNNDFSISYNWQHVHEEPTSKEIRPHIKEVNR